jgi:RimJ/RimL family protein N-acetyltransferase
VEKAVVDRQPLPAPEVKLRVPQQDDCDTILQWRNDPWIVSLSKSQRPVPREEHREWFFRQLTRDDSRLFIIQFGADDGDYRDAGIVRIDKDADRHGVAVVTIYLLREFTRRGIGVQALRQAVARAFSTFPDVDILRAEIQSTNAASIKSFRRAGFGECPKELKSDGPTNMVDLCVYRS